MDVRNINDVQPEVEHNGFEVAAGDGGIHCFCFAGAVKGAPEINSSTH